jgi:L-ascorbate metabolism protein UlaG (beta-lactamase superfamily)
MGVYGAPVIRFRHDAKGLKGVEKMKFFLATLVCGLLAVSVAAQRGQQPIPVRPQQQTFDTAAGPVKITPIYHATVLIEIPGFNIYIDPAKPAPLDDLPSAQLILITDVHPDHMDVDALVTLGNTGARGTQVIAPPAVLADPKFAKAIYDNTSGAKSLSNGETTMAVRNMWTIEAVPMYNLTRKMPNGEPYHVKGRGNGYVMTYGGKRFYFSGDTEGIPEMRALKDIDVAFVCMNVPYTMTPEEAADAVKAFHPKVVIPYHYQGSDPTVFKKALEGTGIEVRLLDFYPKLPAAKGGA